MKPHLRIVRPLAIGASAARTALALGRVRGSVRGASVFAYHDVEPELSTFFSVTPAAFREQLEVAIDCGVQFVDLLELVERQRAGRPVDGLAAVTFDDCLVGIHEHAMPVLAELGVPATIFVVSDELGRSPAWWKASRRTMTLEELQDAAAQGLRLESHSRHHVSLTSLDDDRLLEEVTGSRTALEELFGRPVTLFAYPNGHFNDRVRTAVEAAGYEAAFLFANGRVLPGMDRLTLPRLPMGMWHTRVKLTFDLVRFPASHRPSVTAEESELVWSPGDDVSPPWSAVAPGASG